MNDDNIHFIRKSLKDLFYNLDVYKGIKHQPGAFLIWKEMNIDQLLDELGSFQDKCTAIALLKAFGFNSLHASNQQLPDGMKTEWIRDKMAMKKLLVRN